MCLLVLSACSAAPGNNQAQRPDNDVASEAGVRNQRPAGPDFVVQTFDGKSFSLAEQRGTPVVINFWESW